MVRVSRFMTHWAILDIDIDGGVVVVTAFLFLHMLVKLGILNLESYHDHFYTSLGTTVTITISIYSKG